MIDRLLGKKLIGIKQSTKAIKNGEGRILYVAQDADKKKIDPLVSLAKSHGVEVKYVNTMKELGKMCGIDVGSAATLLMD
ncbi:ribosomal L7Ae/L30e/S12e/Gadd45 family protein [Clostridium fallax]|uniref:Large subunit ribosomal protein L7A n=1 Tax=Clostridium fallax TaxID=1533 RepID=A0A1M4TPF5_9CLOT|nr:ribosomal L7Ae/L30e/S12e/Gadd45 family protein [Clostridium fallax]SHE46323.1 large subunit ribosomal protein L7A [Clostridium fallax]SQB22462.1 ribosomal protein L7AE family protein [Clostridium fallax]